MTNDFSWWQAALAGDRQPIDVNTPQSGFYKVRSKGGEAFIPVAFWWDSNTGELRCQINDRDLNTDLAIEKWPYISKYPVSEAAYYERLQTGKWPNENEVLLGHNQAPVDDSIEALTERIEDIAREAERLIAENPDGAQSKDLADQASDIAQTLGALANKATDLHAIEKRPHLEAGRAVDAKWFGLKDRANTLKTRLKFIVLTPWLTKAQQEAQKAAAEKIAQGAEPTMTPKVTAGANKRGTALRTYYRSEVENWDALREHLKLHPEVLECMQKIADAAAKNQIALPGCKIIAERRAA